MANTTGKQKPVGKTAKSKASGKLLTASALAATLSLKLTKRLPPDQVNKLSNAFPGYVGLLDDAAEQLEASAEFLRLPDSSPCRLNKSISPPVRPSPKRALQFRL